VVAGDESDGVFQHAATGDRARATSGGQMSEQANNNGTNGKRFRFVPEITLGNVLQLVSIGAAVVGMWVNMDKRITAVELRESYAIEERRDLKKSVATLADTQAVLARTVDRMSILLELQSKEGAK
jgi:hypothetical protein